MKVLVATTAGAGHLAGLLPFARAAVRAGHDVRVAAPLSFAPALAAAGLVHEPFADADPAELGAVFARVPAGTMGQADALVVAEVFGRIDLRAALPGMQALVARWRPDVVLREPAELSSYVVAQREGLPCVQANIGTDRIDDRLLPLLQGPLAEVGCDDAGLRAAPRWTVVPPSLDGRPAGVTGSLTAARDPHEEKASGGLPPGLGTGDDPLVYATFGSIAGGMGLFPGLYAVVLEQLSALPVRVLLTVGQAGDPAALGPVPAHVSVQRWWPQADVLPHAAVVLSHGGFGTTQGAVVAGVPQVVVPLFSFDQFVNADQLAAAGVARALVAPGVADLPAASIFPAGPAAAAGTGEAVAAVLADPAYRHRAAGVVEEVAALPSTDDVVATLASLV